MRWLFKYTTENLTYEDLPIATREFIREKVSKAVREAHALMHQKDPGTIIKVEGWRFVNGEITYELRNLIAIKAKEKLQSEGINVTLYDHTPRNMEEEIIRHEPSLRIEVSWR